MSHILERQHKGNMTSITMLKKRTATLGSLSIAATIALTGCGATDSPITASGADANTSAEKTEGFPVGEPFGEAVWTVGDIEQSDEVAVRGDRLIVRTEEGRISGYTSNGDQEWSYDLPEQSNGIDVQILNQTVAVLTGGTSEGEGLNETKMVANVVFLSIEDGSLISEAVLPLASADDFPPTQLKGDGAYLTEDGKLHEFPSNYLTTFPDVASRSDGSDAITAVVNGIPIWSDNGGNNLVTESWRDDDHKGPSLIDQPRGRLLVSERGNSQKYGSVLDAQTGSILFDIECGDDSQSSNGSSTWANPSGGIETVSSPNSQYLISGAIWLSDTEGRCLGGGEGQQDVTLTAVDDAGTAYGMTSEGKLVVVPSNGEHQVSELPETGAHGGVSPFAVMDGDLALHWNGSSISANPIK